jgi:hypothetical protein
MAGEVVEKGAATVKPMNKHGVGASSQRDASDAADQTGLVEVIPGRLSYRVHGNAGDYVGRTTSGMEAFLSGSSGIPGSHHFTSSLHFGKVRALYLHHAFATSPRITPSHPVDPS